MRTRWIEGALSFTAVVLCATSLAASPDSGKALYGRHCAPCHGPQGRGDGPDADLFSVRPRNLREGLIDKYSTDELVQRIRAGRPLVAVDPAALRQRVAQVEAIAAHLERLPRIDLTTLYPGWDLYAERCQECHGPFGSPSVKLPKGVRAPRDLADPHFQSTSSDEDLATAVRHGRHGMPALTPRLSESDAVLVAAYVRLLSPGMELYTTYCGSCHGDDGRGVRSLPGALGMPSVTFDAAYLSSRDPEKLRKDIWHMLADQELRMPHFRSELTEPQARAIVEYLKERP